MNQMQVNTHHTWILWDLDANRQDLQISVFDQNTFSANDPLGSRSVPVRELIEQNAGQRDSPCDGAWGIIKSRLHRVHKKFLDWISNKRY